MCDVQKIGMAYINHLVEKGDYDAAARYYTVSVIFNRLDICEKCQCLSVPLTESVRKC